MPNRNYEKGYRHERAIMQWLKEKGFSTYRSAGSHSQADLIAISQGHVLLIQAKAFHLSLNARLKIVEEMRRQTPTGYYTLKNLCLTEDWREELKMEFNEEDIEP